MSGLYRGWWWAYLCGLAAGYLALATDWWCLVPAFAVAVIAAFRRVA